MTNDVYFNLKNAALSLEKSQVNNNGIFSITNTTVDGGDVTNTGMLTVAGDNTISMNIENSGLINIQKDTNIDLSKGQFSNQQNRVVNLYNNTHINSDISNYSTLHLASQDQTATSSKITGNMDNHGLIYLASNTHSVGNQLIIHGHYTGYQGSQIHMNSLLGDDKSSVDSLIITGDSTGKSAVYVTALGGYGAQTVEGIRVIEVQSNSGAEFTQGGRIVAGSYDYFLARGDDNNNSHWHLTSNDNTQPGPEPTPDPVSIERPEAGSYITNMAAANTLFSMRQADRSGDTHYRDPLTGKLNTTRMWMRNVGGHSNWKSSGSQLSTQSHRYIVQMGG